MAKFDPQLSDPHGDPQTSPQHADPHEFLAFRKKTIQEIHVDRRVVGWSADRHVDHPVGGQISPWPARKVTDGRCFPGEGCHLPAEKRTQHIQAWRLPLLARLWAIWLINCWCVPEAGQRVSVGKAASDTLPYAASMWLGNEKCA